MNNEKDYGVFLEKVNNYLTRIKNKIEPKLIEAYKDTTNEELRFVSVFALLKETLKGYKNSQLAIDYAELLDKYLIKNKINENNILEKMDFESVEELLNVVVKDIENDKKVKDPKVEEVVNFIKTKIADRKNGNAYSLGSLLELINANREQLGFKFKTAGLNIDDSTEVLNNYELGESYVLNLDKIDTKEVFDRYREELEKLGYTFEPQSISSIVYDKQSNKVLYPQDMFTKQKANVGSLLFLSKMVYEIAKANVESLNQICLDEVYGEKSNDFKFAIEKLAEKEKIEEYVKVISSLLTALNMQIVLLDEKYTKPLIELFEYNIATSVYELNTLLSVKNINSASATYAIGAIVKIATNKLFDEWQLSSEKLLQQYVNIGKIQVEDGNEHDFSLCLKKYEAPRAIIRDCKFHNFDITNITSSGRFNSNKQQALFALANLQTKVKSQNNSGANVNPEIKTTVLNNIEQIESVLNSHTKIPGDIINDVVYGFYDICAIKEEFAKIQAKAQAPKANDTDKPNAKPEQNDKHIAKNPSTKTAVEKPEEQQTKTSEKPTQKPEEPTTDNSFYSTSTYNNSSFNGNTANNDSIYTHNSNQGKDSENDSDENQSKPSSKQESNKATDTLSLGKDASAGAGENAPAGADKNREEFDEAKQKQSEAEKKLQELEAKLKAQEEAFKTLQEQNEKLNKIVDAKVKDEKLIKLGAKINEKLNAILVDVVEKIANNKTDNDVLEQTEYCFNELLQSDENDAPRIAKNILFIFKDKKMFNMLYSLRQNLLNFCKNASEKIAKDFQTLYTIDFEKQSDINNLANIAIDCVLEEYKKKELSSIENKYKDDPFQMIQEKEKIEKIFEGAKYGPDLMKKIKDNLLYSSIEKIVLCEYSEIIKCYQDNIDGYKFSSENLDSAIEKVFNQSNETINIKSELIP